MQTAFSSIHSFFFVYFFYVFYFVMMCMIAVDSARPSQAWFDQCFSITFHRFFSSMIAFHTVYLVAIIALLFSGLSFVGL